MYENFFLSPLARYSHGWRHCGQRMGRGRVSPVDGVKKVEPIVQEVLLASPSIAIHAKDILPTCSEAQKRFGEDAVVIVAAANFEFARRLFEGKHGAIELARFLGQKFDPEGIPAVIIGTDRDHGLQLIQGHSPSQKLELTGYRLELSPKEFSVVVLLDSKIGFASLQKTNQG
jgi:hypothetical protein